jgi:hypothetical protein
MRGVSRNFTFGEARVRCSRASVVADTGIAVKIYSYVNYSIIIFSLNEISAYIKASKREKQ